MGRKMSKAEQKLQEETLAELEYLTQQIAVLIISSVRKEYKLRDMSNDDVEDSFSTWGVTVNENLWYSIREDPLYSAAHNGKLKREREEEEEYD